MLGVTFKLNLWCTDHNCSIIRFIRELAINVIKAWTSLIWSESCSWSLAVKLYTTVELSNIHILKTRVLCHTRQLGELSEHPTAPVWVTCCALAVLGSPESHAQHAGDKTVSRARSSHSAQVRFQYAKSGNSEEWSDLIEVCGQGGDKVNEMRDSPIAPDSSSAVKKTSDNDKEQRCASMFLCAPSEDSHPR